MSLAKKSFLTKLEKLGFRYLWDSEGHQGRKFSMFTRDEKPFLQVMVMDHAEGKGFQVFSTLGDTNSILDDIKALKQNIERGRDHAV